MKVIKYPAKEEWSEIVKRPHLDVSPKNVETFARYGRKV